MRLIDAMRIDFDEVDISECTDVDDIIWAVEKLIDAQRTVDAVPVVHGRWIWNEECECWSCSVCEASALNDYRGNSTASDYCPNCGADMRERKDDKGCK